jgi:hypothetical protein
LDQVDNKDLLELGIPPGDDIQLKKGAPPWWASSDAQSLKCKSTTLPPNSPPDPKKTQFEQCMNGEGGGFSVFGNGIQPGNPDGPAREYSWWYYCKVLRKCRKYLTITSPSLLLAKDLMKTTLDFDQQGMFVALYCTLCLSSRFFMS